LAKAPGASGFGLFESKTQATAASRRLHFGCQSICQNAAYFGAGNEFPKCFRLLFWTTGNRVAISLCIAGNVSEELHDQIRFDVRVTSAHNPSCFPPCNL